MTQGHRNGTGGDCVNTGGLRKLIIPTITVWGDDWATVQLGVRREGDYK